MALYPRDDLRNCVIFIADSYRYDYLSEKLKEDGLVMKTHTASTFTASSLPSILTGQYPLTHRIWSFSDQLAETPHIFNEFENTGWNAETIWGHIDDPTDKPPYKLLRLDTQNSIEDIDPPFLHIEHHRGGHIPFGDGNTREMFDEYDGTYEFSEHFANRPTELRTQYEKGVRSAEDRFFEIIQLLRDRSMLEETLVIFTSDHGELLGEYGHYTHGAPMVPEVVTVPTVFFNPELPKKTPDKVVSSVDIIPTVLGATGRTVPQHLPGIDLSEAMPSEDRIVYSQQWAQGKIAEYQAAGVWGSSGGRVRHYGSRIRRLAQVLIRYTRSPIRSLLISELPKSIPSIFTTQIQKNVTFGNGPPDDDHLPERVAFTKGETMGKNDQPTKEQLRALGYLE